MRTKYRLGIDAGGTFTDLVLAARSGDIRLYKALSTPDDPTRAIEEGMKLIAEDLGESPAEIVSNSRPLHQRHHRRPQCADPAQRRKDRLDLYGRPRGFDRDQARPQGGRLSLRSRISGGGHAGAALSAQGRARAGDFERIDQDAAARGRCPRRLSVVYRGGRRGRRDLVLLVGPQSAATSGERRRSFAK